MGIQVANFRNACEISELCFGVAEKGIKCDLLRDLEGKKFQGVNKSIDLRGMSSRRSRSAEFQSERR